MLFNRDLSWLSFNDRVLEEAGDKTVPLYERMKFLAIFSSNLDEFFRVRYPAVMALTHLDKKTIKKEYLLNKEEVAENISQYIKQQLTHFGSILHQEILPELLEHKVNFLYDKAIPEALESETREIFLSIILSFIQPVFLGNGSGQNFVPVNSRLYFVVTLFDDKKSLLQHVMVNIPSHKVARFYTLTPINGVQQVVFLDDIIRTNLPLIFPGQKCISVYSIKCNRDAALSLTDEYSDNLLDKIERKLSGRELGDTSRCLYEKGLPANLQMFLASTFKIGLEDMYEGGRYHNLSDLMKFPVFDKSLEYDAQPPILYPPDTINGDIFDIISKKDVLLHLPYHTYVPVLTFFNQAALDADVTEIFITLYRVASESHIVNALISAAKNGKKVTAFIELKARFDEANNIKWSRVMKKAGITLIYSEPSIKVHSKIALVLKNMAGKKSAYAVLCTGNFNESTASLYTDHVLLTTDKPICKELHQLFGFLKKKKLNTKDDSLRFKDLFVTKFNLIDDFEALINLEISKAEKGLPALIRLKVNNLEEPYFINLLSNASQKGVTVQLIVRSICCLIPGKAGYSENIQIRRIVGRYLEHPRIFIFGEDADATVVMGSSDLMTRNLRKRIEVCVKVKDTECRNQLLRYFYLQWRDNTKSRKIGQLMTNERISDADGTPAYNAQKDIYNYLREVNDKNEAIHDI